MPHYIHKKTKRKTNTQNIDLLMNIACVVHPLLAIPQVYETYSTQNVEGVSLVTWFGFMALGLIFLAYGIAHKIKPFIVTQILWFTIDFLIVLGVLLYQ